MDVLCHLPEEEDEGSCSNDLGAEDGSDDKGEDEEHIGDVVGGDGSGRDAVVVTDSGTFMCKPCGFKGLAVQMRVYQIGDPMMFNAVPSLPLAGASFYML